MVILGIISYIVVSKFEAAHTNLQYQTLIKKMAADVRYARDMALTGGQGTQFYIDETNNRYYLKWDDGTFLQNPVGGNDFVVELGSREFASTVITATAFNGGRLDFTKEGMPLNAGNAFSGTLNLVTLNAKVSLSITANTGLVRVID